MEEIKDKHHALELSVAKWKKNYEASLEGKLERSGLCPCCTFSVNARGFADCKNCLIADYTLEEDCYGTPFYSVFLHDSNSVLREYQWLKDLLDGKKPEVWGEDD